ncbi:hypothetical protein D3C71_1546550 [compost metagenome]
MKKNIQHVLTRFAEQKEYLLQHSEAIHYSLNTIISHLEKESTFDSKSAQSIIQETVRLFTHFDRMLLERSSRKRY